MNKVMTLINYVKSKNINNLMASENSEYAIFKRTVKMGMALMGGVLGAYIVYNQGTGIMEKSGLLKNYNATASNVSFVKGMDNVLGAAIGYSFGYSFGPVGLYAVMKLSEGIDWTLKSSLKIAFLNISYYAAKLGIWAAKELLNTVIDATKLAYEWKRVLFIAMLAGYGVYAQPQIAWEILGWIYENYEILMKSYEVTDNNHFLIKSLVKSLVLSLFLYVIQFRAEMKERIESIWYMLKSFTNNIGSYFTNILMIQLFNFYYRLEMRLNGMIYIIA
ncbi:MAG: hypothetical protein C5B43_00695 [Verrucomicrobia bacterium]|nr:MAG: hypothetical protein C5B43_00695 [Verrucomicrobiota bacterium]